MAAKKRRASPLDEPPTASSSSDEEEEEPKPSQQQSKEDEVEEDQSSSEEEDEEEESDEEEENQLTVLSQSSAKNPPPPPPTKSQSKPKPSSSDESESGTTGSDSDEDDDAPPPSSKVKSLTSKPMDQNLNPNSKTKAQTQTETPSSPPPNKSGNKRVAENNNAHANDFKRAKKKATDTTVSAASAGGSDDEMETEEDVKKSSEDSKKMFQRVWREEDEITIVKSMSDFLLKTGNDPLKYLLVFYDFVKKSLSFEATSTQLRQKIRRIKEKYNSAQKRKKNGVDPTFAKPHDQKLYELSKKVWGKDSNEVEEKGNSNGRTPKSPKKEAPIKITASAKKPARTKKAVPEANEKAVPEANEETESPKQVVALKESVKGESDNEVALSEMFRHDKGVGISGLNEAVVRRGLEFMDESNKAALVSKWKKFRADEFKMFMRRTDLIKEQAALIWEAYQSSNP